MDASYELSFLSPRRVPPRGLALSVAALAIPLLASVLAPEWVSGTGLLPWVTPLIPAFLLAYYRGWQGTALAMATGMAVLALAHVFLLARGVEPPDWRISLTLVVVFLGVSLGAGALTDLLRRQRVETDRLVLNDPVTGLPNRRHAQIELDARFRDSSPAVGRVALRIDVDQLSDINDRYGYQAGDALLLAIASLIREALPPQAFLARWGGGHFLALLSDVEPHQGRALADGVRAAVLEAPLRWQPASVSVGVATYDPSLANAEMWVAAAEHALARARESGRGGVASYQAAGAELTLPDRGGPVGALATEEAAAEPPRGDDRVGGPSVRDSRLVVVDDETSNLLALGRALRSLGFRNVETFADPHAAVHAIEQEPPDLILLDLRMPEMDGFAVLERLGPILDAEGFLPVLILSGERQADTRRRALRAGGKDFLDKPYDLAELEARILNLLDSKQLHGALRDAKDRLEDRVRERTQELEEARIEILARLARAAEYRDDDTGRHQERVGVLAELLARGIGVEEEMVRVLRLAAPLHDVGKIAIPDAILRKPGPLTEAEYARMKEHTLLGAEILAGSSSPVLEVARIVALTHHERWDGTGYPAGRAGEDIPLVGRIVAVADVFDSLTHKRPYKEAYAPERALGIVREGSGTEFDARIASVLLELAAEGRLADLTGD